MAFNIANYRNESEQASLSDARAVVANAQKNLNKAQRRGQRARDALAAVQADAAADADEVAECEQAISTAGALTTVAQDELDAAIRSLKLLEQEVADNERIRREAAIEAARLEAEARRIEREALIESMRAEYELKIQDAQAVLEGELAVAFNLNEQLKGHKGVMVSADRDNQKAQRRVRRASVAHAAVQADTVADVDELAETRQQKDLAVTLASQAQDTLNATMSPVRSTEGELKECNVRVAAARAELERLKQNPPNYPPRLDGTVVIQAPAAPPGAITSTVGGFSRGEFYRRVLTEYYQRHNPSKLEEIGGIVEFYILKGGDASSGLDGAFQLQQKILDWYGEPLDVSGDPGPDMIITQATTDTFASTKAGWLKKQGAEKKNWKKRWFVLDIDALRYFESEPNLMGTSSTLKGEIVLTHVQSIGKAMATGDVEEAEMKIDTRKRMYHIRGPVAEIDEWIAAIRIAIGQQGARKAGWMTKEGEGGGNWKRRYFILHLDALRYFEKVPTSEGNAARNLKGSIQCRNIVSVGVVSRVGNRVSVTAGTVNRAELKVEVPGRTYRMQCASPADCEEWCREIKKVVDHVRRHTAAGRAGSRALGSRGGSVAARGREVYFSLDVTCFEARRLSNTQMVSAQSPYATLLINGDQSKKSFSTHVQASGDEEAVWNFKCTFNTIVERTVNQCMLRCIVKSRGSIVDTEIGACDIPLRNFLDGQLHGPAWHTLQYNGKVRGEVRLQMQLAGGNIVMGAHGGREQLINAGTTLTQEQAARYQFT